MILVPRSTSIPALIEGVPVTKLFKRIILSSVAIVVVVINVSTVNVLIPLTLFESSITIPESWRILPSMPSKRGMVLSVEVSGPITSPLVGILINPVELSSLTADFCV